MFSYIVIIIVIGLKVSSLDCYGSTAVLPFIVSLSDYLVSDVWQDLRVLALS